MDSLSYSSVKSMYVHPSSRLVKLPFVRVRAPDSLNSRLSEFEPLTLLIAPLLTLFLAQIIGAVFGVVHEKGLKACLVGLTMSFPQVSLFKRSQYLIFLFNPNLDWLETNDSVGEKWNRMIPAIQKYIDSEKQKKKNRAEELPVKGLGVLLEKMETENRNDAIWQSKCSGTVYIGGSESEGHFALIKQACSMFSHTNPLHIDVFQSVVRFESEVVAMTAALLGSKETVSGGQICGNMTSGGTESIVLTVKSSREYMKYKKGITRPEMIIPESGHSAYNTAAEYFNIKLWRVPVDKDFRADVKAMRRHINRNTIMIVGSAPGFPHGIIDPIEHQFVAVTEWSGGLYVSPTIAGSRPGSLAAGAWAAMMSLDEEGYLQNTRKIMEASKRLEKGVRGISELFVLGKPDMTIVAFGSKSLDIFHEVNDVMSSKRWHLNAQATETQQV
ncbi:hypothetical protein N665_0988s0013 [Sinapis alba]|nr:hypothetical protein N665_0988s0013 [Sinapis alba]